MTTSDLVTAHLTYLAKVGNEHDTKTVTDWIAHGRAPCFECGKVCFFPDMIHTTTGRAFCCSICEHAYAR